MLAAYKAPDAPDVRVTAVATSAARDADNSEEFGALLRDAGIELTVIPGEREAALSFAGASCEFGGERLIVVDIGGGSTEVIVGTAGCEPDCMHSFDIGCRRVTEKFLASDPPSKDCLLYTSHPAEPRRGRRAHEPVHRHRGRERDDAQGRRRGVGPGGVPVSYTHLDVYKRQPTAS